MQLLTGLPPFVSRQATMIDSTRLVRRGKEEYKKRVGSTVNELGSCRRLAGGQTTNSVVLPQLVTVPRPFPVGKPTAEERNGLGTNNFQNHSCSKRKGRQGTARNICGNRGLTILIPNTSRDASPRTDTDIDIKNGLVFDIVSVPCPKQGHGSRVLLGSW
jgi:hypothetical protein